jgi:hypothetical protein
MKRNAFLSLAIAAVVLTNVSFAAITLYTPMNGDAQYAWNSKYGPYGYTTGGTTMGVGLYFGAPYGNDYTVSIFEIPIAALAGQTLTSATLQVDSLGFGSSYYYGSAQIGWMNTGANTLTGDVVADGVGSMSPTPSGYEIWDTYDIPEAVGIKSFDFTVQVQADIDAGRTFSTFALHGSRDTYGSIYTAESGQGPRLVVDYPGASLPEPATLVIFGAAVPFLLRRKWRHL